MQRAVKWTFIGVVLVLAVPSFAIDIDAALTPAVRVKLDAGKAVIVKNTVEDAGAKVISNSGAMIVVNKPVDAVWQVIKDFEKLPEFIPRMISSEKYYEKDGVVGIRQALKILWKKVNYNVLQREDVENHTLTFELDKSQQNDIAETRGQWILRPYGEDKCLAVYTLALDTGMPVPRFIQNMLLRQDLPGTLDAIKQRTETDGKYTK